VHYTITKYGLVTGTAWRVHQAVAVMIKALETSHTILLPVLVLDHCPVHL